MAGWAVVHRLAAAPGPVPPPIGGSRPVPLSTAGALLAIGEIARLLSRSACYAGSGQFTAPGARDHSCTICRVAPGPASPRRRKQPLVRYGQLLARRVGCAPPLCKGSASWHCSWLAGLASAFLADSAAGGNLPRLRLGQCLAEPVHSPWIAMSCCVALSIVTAFLEVLLQGRSQSFVVSGDGSARDAAFRGRLRAGGAAGPPWRAARWLAAGSARLVARRDQPHTRSAFEPWTDGQRRAGHRATGRRPGRRPVAGGRLAICAIAINMAALCLARALSALPRAPDVD